MKYTELDGFMEYAYGALYGMKCLSCANRNKRHHEENCTYCNVCEVVVEGEEVNLSCYWDGEPL